MEKPIMNDLEVAPDSVVRQAAQDFAQTLGASPAYQAFAQADDRLIQDMAAQSAFQAYQAKTQSLRAMQMLNAISPEEQAEWERLRDELLAQPTMIAYNRAQAELMAMCQEIGDRISPQIGLDYASACSTSGCC